MLNQTASGAQLRSHHMPPSAEAVLEDSLAWYRKHAWAARWAYHFVEVAILVVGSLIPTVTAFGDRPKTTAMLGASIVILAGLRPIFRWQDDWLRFTEACAQLVTERELFRFRVGDYEHEDRDRRLV